jgi:Rrf2 family nitric oxide-sensitive transcriptional repressor
VRITKHTDYALRVLLYLAVRGDERATSHAIAEAHGISLHHLHKVVRSLAGLGLVRLYRGAGGGVELARPADEISVGTTMRALDELDALIECFDPATDACVISPVCGLKGALRDAQEAFYASLDAVTIAAAAGGARTARLRDLTGG